MLEFSTYDVLSALRTRWRTIVFCTALALVAGIAYLRSATYLYLVSYRITASSESGAGGLNRSGLGGIGLLSGFMAGGEAASPFDKYLAAIYSREVATVMLRNPQVARGVFDDEWNPACRCWRAPTRRWAAVSDGVRALLGAPAIRWTPPGPAQMQQYLLDNVRVNRDPKNPVVTIGLKHPSPSFGRVLLQNLDMAADLVVRQQSRRRASAYTLYLRGLIQTTQIVEHRAALVYLLGEQERVSMMASSPPPFAADVIETAAASPRPTSPVAWIILTLSALIGATIGGLIAILSGLRAGMTDAEAADAN